MGREFPDLVRQVITLGSPFRITPSDRSAVSALYERLSPGHVAQISDVLPETANVRTMVHEYGGAAYRVGSGDLVYSEFADQRLYLVRQDGSTTPLTSEPSRPKAVRYADAVRQADG